MSFNEKFLTNKKSYEIGQLLIFESNYVFLQLVGDYRGYMPIF